MAIHITQDTDAEMTYVYLDGQTINIDYNADGSIAGIEIFGLPEVEDITNNSQIIYDLEVEL